jgi:hypothetical protein
MIQVIGKKLIQWDVGRRVIVTESNATHVHFANQGDSKAVIMEVQNGEVLIPDYLLQTGKQVMAYAVLDGITLEKGVFFVNKRERPENYIYEHDDRNYIYELIDKAETAVNNANETLEGFKAAVESGKYNGITPHIGANGNWFIGEEDTGKTSRGEPGRPGKDAPQESVLYTEQELTEGQKTQARTNIGAVSIEEVEELLGIEEEFSVEGELVKLDLDIEPDTKLEVISKIHRNETWGLSNTLVLHQVSGSNFVDLTNYLGGVGKVFEVSGLTAVINDNGTITISGTNESTGWAYLINQYRWGGEHSDRVYPAGTYTIPKGFTMAVRAAKYPDNVTITGMGNLSGTVTIPEPFRIIMLQYAVRAGTTVDVTLPLGIFYGKSISETGYEYNGYIHTATFDAPVYDGEFNWMTGELKDIDGNTVGYYDAPEIKSLPGINYFWTCFGENTVSNASNEPGKVILRNNETAPEDTIPSICDFMLTPATPEAAYGLYYGPFLPGGQFAGNDVPVLTTKGTLSVKDADGVVKYSRYIDPMFNTRSVSDVLTQNGLEKKWSEKFYLSKDPVSITHYPPSYSGPPDAYVFVWEFDESEFVNTGIPAKIHDIPMASPCFINNDNSENNVAKQELWNGTPYPAFFSYNAETGKYTLTARGIQGNSIKYQLTSYSKVHFYYQLETPYTLPFNFAMGIDAGDVVSFDVDLADNQPYIDSISGFKNRSVEPSVTAFVPRSVEGAMSGMNNIARLLNTDDAGNGDATVQGYSWIGAGDGLTDYTVQIQSKLDELHNVSNGGTIHLGPGTYPISKSLIVYGNTQIIGNGHTIIEQKADNTHAVIWNGSNIHMCDLTIKLSGECTETTACIFANSNNIGENRDARYPENTYVQYCSTRNVTLTGTYRFSWEDGYAYLSERALAYRGVGVLQYRLFFNYYNCDNLVCRHLYAGVYGGGGSSNYCIYATECRFAVYGGGGNNIFDIHGHAYYDHNGRDGTILGTDYVYYSELGHANTITVGVYDIQYSKGLLYFDGNSQMNHYIIPSSVTSTSLSVAGDFKRVTDYGRGNFEVQPTKEMFAGVGSFLPTISGLQDWNTQFNPSVHNALSGAGVWGTITSNKEWKSDNGISLRDVCRYPKETLKTGLGLASAICEASPSVESPIEIVIDISDRPVSSYRGFWVQFDHRYVAEDYKVLFDTTNDGSFDTLASEITQNNNAVSYNFNYQTTSTMVYRIKIVITKALQIPNFEYNDASYNEYTIDYNPNGYIGIVNIGMPSNEAYGRAFLGECGGSLYGNVDMHQNTLKNLPNPVDDGDAISKAYLEERLAALEALIAKM